MWGPAEMPAGISRAGEEQFVSGAIRGKIGSSGGPGQSCQWNPATGQAENLAHHEPHEGNIRGSG